MMYRDWREVTKKMLTLRSKGESMDHVKLPGKKMQRAETKLYVKWVKGEIKKNPKAFEEYNQGKGIIATRERFLEWMKSGEGKESAELVEKDEPVEPKSEKEFGKTIIVPIAVPGCGELRLDALNNDIDNILQEKLQSLWRWPICLALAILRAMMSK